MPGDPIHHDVEALFRVGDDLRDAVLSHDLAGVRLHARQMAGLAALLGFGGVEAAALAPVECVRTDAPPARVARGGAPDYRPWNSKIKEPTRHTNAVMLTMRPTRSAGQRLDR